ncbi:MAG: type II secretion system protein J [Candidatus Nanopelagicales bacterium]
MNAPRAGLLARLRAVRGDHGLTLAELMVTMVLMGIVGTIMINAVIQVTRTVTKAQASADSLDVARVGMARLTKNVRSGMAIQRSGLDDLPALAAISPTQLTVYASLGPVPTKITYSINANRELVEKWYVGNAASNPYWTFSNTARTTVVARKIPAGAVLFTYYDANGNPIANQTSTNEDDLIQIRSVKIALTVDVDPARGGGPVTVSNTVVLPNLGIAKR